MEKQDFVLTILKSWKNRMHSDDYNRLLYIKKEEETRSSYSKL